MGNDMSALHGGEFNEKEIRDIRRTKRDSYAAAICRLQVSALYQAHAPNMLEKTDSLVAKHTGKEKMLVRKILDKYTSKEVPEDNPSRADIRKRAVSVCCRKRPLFPHEIDKRDFDVISTIPGVIPSSPGLKPQTSPLTVHFAKTTRNLSELRLRNIPFFFDHVFDEERDNTDVYNSTAGLLLRELLRMEACGGETLFASGEKWAPRTRALFCYGATGSGKTHTTRGIQLLLAKELFDTFQCQGKLDVFVSVFEIAGNHLKDLLVSGPNERDPEETGDENKQTRGIHLREGSEGEMHVRGATQVKVATSQAYLQLMEQAAAARQTKATGVHDGSSRTHAVYRLSLFEQPIKESAGVDAKQGQEGKLFGRLLLVDLAGSEWKNDRKDHDATLRSEAAEINSSLMALKRCIRAIRRRGQQTAQMANGAGGPHIHIPFRENLLTKLLKGPLTMPFPQSRTVVVATVSPSSSDTEHTLDTLRHASLMDGQAEAAGKKDAVEVEVPLAGAVEAGSKSGAKKGGYKKVSGRHKNKIAQARANLTLVGAFALFKGENAAGLTKQRLQDLLDVAAPGAESKSEEEGKMSERATAAAAVDVSFDKFSRTPETEGEATLDFASFREFFFGLAVDPSGLLPLANAVKKLDVHLRAAKAAAASDSENVKLFTGKPRQLDLNAQFVAADTGHVQTADEPS